MIENKDYELIPDVEDEQSWNVRILTGEFVETVIKFMAIRIDPKNITFRFDVISAPSDYIVVENPELQETVGEILINIIDTSIKDGTGIFNEVKK